MRKLDNEKDINFASHRRRLEDTCYGFDSKEKVPMHQLSPLPSPTAHRPENEVIVIATINLYSAAVENANQRRCLRWP